MPRIAVWIASTLPLIRLIYLGWLDELGANPTEHIIRSLGTSALIFLCLTLSLSPLHQLTGFVSWIKIRRHMGLTCFFYAGLHFLAWIWFEHQWALMDMGTDILKRPYLGFGAIALAGMVPLAATSNQRMMRRLGTRWKSLHRSIYIIAIFAMVHYFFHKQAKNDLLQVMIFGGIVCALLGFRATTALIFHLKHK